MQPEAVLRDGQLRPPGAPLLSANLPGLEDEHLGRLGEQLVESLAEGGQVRLDAVGLEPGPVAIALEDCVAWRRPADASDGVATVGGLGARRRDEACERSVHGIGLAVGGCEEGDDFEVGHGADGMWSGP